jgi:flavin prenyltransferase
MSHPVVLAITGASGALYGCRLLQALCKAGRTVHLAISDSGRAVLHQELKLQLPRGSFDPRLLLRAQGGWPSARPVLESAAETDAFASQIVVHQPMDFMTPIASGSFLTSGMVICPCSGSTLAGIATASSQNLIQRAAEVHLKERRKLILVPRETPLSDLMIENMLRVSRSGAVVLPASPGWYHDVTDLDSIVDFVVARILDQLGIDRHALMKRWGEPS